MTFIWDTQNSQWDAQDEVSTSHPRYAAGEDDLIIAKRHAEDVAPMLVDIALTGEDQVFPTPLHEEQRIILEGAEGLGDSEADEQHPDPIGDAQELVRDAVKNHETLTAWAIAQRFRVRLRQTLHELAANRERANLPADLPELDSIVGRHLRGIDERNKGYGEHTCASHDFCDANMPMSEAFSDIMGREVVTNHQDDMDLWNAAWDITKREGFADPSYSPIA